MRTLIRTTVTTVTTVVVAVGVVGPLPDATGAAPGPADTTWQLQGWWCRLTQLC